jgi:N-acetylglucosaminyldiphosphoundecaprenol N-acetyl-beta-D-mannosaminyltransferase
MSATTRRQDQHAPDPARQGTDATTSPVLWPHRHVIGMRVDGCDYAGTTARIIDWARANVARQVFVANVHMVMEAHDDPLFRRTVNGADLVTPDGMPLVWALRMMGIGMQRRVYGPTLTLYVCEAAAEAGLPIGLYGGTEDSLEDFSALLASRYPGIRITCKIAPPFRPLSLEEDAAVSARIIQSGARILFVGIGCPKQERWIADHRNRIPVVMIGVGAAFDFHSGRVRQAPGWIQKMGLEWLFRLVMEPRRLWKRYARHNPRFMVLLARQLVREIAAGR